MVPASGLGALESILEVTCVEIKHFSSMYQLLNLYLVTEVAVIVQCSKSDSVYLIVDITSSCSL